MSDSGKLNFSIDLDLDQLRQAAEEAKKLLDGIGSGTGGNIDNVQQQIAHLSEVIRENQQALMAGLDELAEWEAAANEAFNTQDPARMQVINDAIAEQSKNINKVTAGLEEYRTLMSTAMKELASETDNATLLFKDDKQLAQAEELRLKIGDLREEIAQLGQGADTSDLQVELQKATQELGNLETKAAQAAAKVGTELGGKAAEAQQQLLNMNIAVENQERVLEVLQEALKGATQYQKECNKTLQEGSPEIANATAQVTEYTAQVEAAKQKLADLKAQQKEAQDEWNQVSEEISSHDSIMVKMLGGYDNYKKILGQLPGPLQSVIGGIGGMTGAAKAFIATPLGAIISAIVIALQALFSWFNKSTEGQQAFAKISGYVSGVLEYLGQIVQKVGKFIYDCFTDPQKAIKEFWESLKSWVVDRIEGLGGMFQSIGKIIEDVFSLNWGNISGHYDELVESAKKTVSFVTDAAAAINEFGQKTADIVQQQKKLEQDRKQWAVTESELKKQMAEQEIIARDQSKSEKERNAALAKQREYQKQISDGNKDLLQQELDLAKARYENGASDNAENLEAYQKAQTALNDYETSALKTEKTLMLSGNRIAKNAATTASKLESAATKAAKAEENRLKALESLNQKEMELRDANEKAALDSMEEGTEKKVAKIEADYNAQITTITKKANELREANRKAGVTDVNSESGLTDEQQELINASALEAQKKYEKELEKVYEDEWKAMVQSYGTYTQQLLLLDQDYKKKRDALYEKDEEGNTTSVLKKGVTDANVANLDKEQKKTEEALAEKFATQSQQYQNWVNMVSTFSLQQLRELLQIAESELESLKEAGGSDEEIAMATAEVNKLKELVDDMELSPKPKTDTEWQKLYKTLNTCEKSFEKVGNAIGGTTGEIIKSAGQIATSTLSMFNSLNELTTQTDQMTNAVKDVGKGVGQTMTDVTEGVKTSTEKMSQGVAGAINTVEKASVILTIISAALSIATAIANLFNNDDKKQKEIDNLQQQIDQLQWELDNTASVRIQNQLGDALTVVRDIYADTLKEIERMHKASQDYGDTATKSLTKVQKETEAYNKSIQKIADTYANLSYTTTQVLGTERYKNAREELENYAEQLKLIQQQYDLENAKKKTDQQQLIEYQQQMDEIAATMATLVDELVEDIIGGSAADIASQLGDAFIEAFQSGEDAAKAWGDTVDDIVSGIIKNLLISEIIEPQIGAVFDKYKDLWYKNGEFAGTEAIINSMQDFADDLNSIEGEFADVWDALSESMLDYFTTDSERTGVNEGIATASQESVDELNGRATAIQSHTYSINETTKSLLVTSNLILQSIVNIEGNTDGLSTRMATVEGYVKEMRDTTNDMYRLGVKIR